MQRREEEEKTKESCTDVDRNKTDQDKATGEEMRERAMERLAQTKKRNGKDEPQKKRQTREAVERDSQLRQDELDMKRKQDEATAATQQALFTQLQDQQQLQIQQQQQQQQQFMHMMQMMLNSQQAQTQAVIELFKKGP